ncbi:DNA adenine methylase [Mesorhizobium neociceri]|uniref:Site-specific DNA-methyltransferase (adenine-specific) n=1 Tax=Mesorhizobium neociceri TaxID=1307853 RepID=A0A838BCJ4_9HYPH|nr:Dam family site-specific DNA-(adenine-N6)-methyltransferase [Mesorhizobium neociceri]MBA1143294.1 Dam family site-specific DNA-(adenine-N6)-methyltransferase [Mesorhizobium neociceri]
MTQQALKPFLKWAGGKRWLFESGQFSLPSFSGRYVEPFLGGGAVFFENQPKNAVLSDCNWRLIELFVVIRDNLNPFEALMQTHAEAHSTGYYYELRSKQLGTSITRAAQFLYLNRTCWNGLYRENLKGNFNVPIGTKQTVIFDADDFPAWSSALQGTHLKHRDFEEAIDEAEAGDFVFVDPPYTVRHNMNGFVKYNQNIFAWSDQIRLRDALLRAHKRGVAFAMTNADHESIRDLYSGFGRHRQLSRYSVIAGKAAYRSQSTELLITG